MVDLGGILEPVGKTLATSTVQGIADNVIGGINGAGGGNADPSLQKYLDAVEQNRAQTFADMIVFIREDRLNENLRAAIARIKTAAQIQR